MNKEEIIYKYLRYGFCRPFPTSPTPQNINLPFGEIKNKLRILLEDSIDEIKNPDSCILQLSGGFDTSVLASYLWGIRSICTGPNDSLDVHYSFKVSNHFKTWHRFVPHHEILERNDFASTLIEMNRINKYPRSFRNDFGLFCFLKYIREYTDFIIDGKGIEFLMLGYYTIYKKIIEKAIFNKHYLLKNAHQYLDEKFYDCPDDVGTLEIGKEFDDPKYTLDLIGWWNGTFSDGGIKTLTGINPYPEPSFDKPEELIDTIMNWFGAEYVGQRTIDYALYFGVRCIHPYGNADFVNFCRTIPIEMKKCMNHHKYLFYQSFGGQVPPYVVSRAKVGLNVSDDFFLQHKPTILEMVDSYLLNNPRTRTYLNTFHVERLVSDYKNNGTKFPEVWSLLNLAIWMEVHDDTAYSE